MCTSLFATKTKKLKFNSNCINFVLVLNLNLILFQLCCNEIRLIGLL